MEKGDVLTLEGKEMGAETANVDFCTETILVSWMGDGTRRAARSYVRNGRTGVTFGHGVIDGIGEAGTVSTPRRQRIIQNS